MKSFPIIWLIFAHLQSSEGFGWLGGAVFLPRLYVPSLEHGLRAGVMLRVRAMRAPIQHRIQRKWVLSGSSANEGNKFGNPEEPENTEFGSFDASQFSALSKNVASPSVRDNSWKKLSKIYVLLFNARTDNEGICELIIM
jgi:hypothetical protein